MKPPIKFVLLLMLFAVAAFFSCKKDEKDDINGDQPIITSINPSTGPKGTIVTITGLNFSNFPGDIAVFINNRQAQVLASEEGSIKISVPPKAGTGLVKVYVKNEAGTGPVFNYVYTVAVTTFSGNGVAGYADGNGTVAQFNTPRGLAIDQFDNIYVADELNHRIRRIATNGQVQTLAGMGIAGATDGDPSVSQFNHPFDIAADLINGYFYVADRNNHLIRRVSLAGDVTTAVGTAGAPGFTDGPGLSARLSFPTGIALQGEIATLYIADGGNHCIRMMNELNIVTTLAGTNVPGQSDGSGTSARFNQPFDIAWDSSGVLYVSDASTHNIRKITENGIVTTVTGAGIAGYFDGPQLLARFDMPNGIFVDNNELFVCDHNNQRIRAVSSVGISSTITGNGTAGFDNGSGTAITFNGPGGIVRNSAGEYFISETGNHVIRKMIVD